jgi:hypothetical protein
VLLRHNAARTYLDGRPLLPRPGEHGELIAKVPEPDEFYDDSALRTALDAVAEIDAVGVVDVSRNRDDVPKPDVGR